MHIKKPRMSLTVGERRRSALVNAGIAPSSFGFRHTSQAHRDRKAEMRNGERKHKSAWA